MFLLLVRSHATSRDLGADLPHLPYQYSGSFNFCRDLIDTNTKKMKLMFVAFIWIGFASGFSSLSPLRDRVEYLLRNPQQLRLLYAQHKLSPETSDLQALLRDIHEDNLLQQNSSAPRHIVTLLTDDQGYADVGYNDPTFLTPTLDFFAHNGIKLTSFYVQVRFPL